MPPRGAPQHEAARLSRTGWPPLPSAEHAPLSDDAREPAANRGPAGEPDYAAGKWSQTDLAYIYGITHDTVTRIVNSQAHIYPTTSEQDS